VDAIHDVYSANIFFGGMYPNSSKWDRNAPWIQADAPAKGQAIRQAMSMAIDRETILKKVLFGLGTLTTSPLIQFPSIATDLDPAWTAPYDPDQAKKLLAQGGYPHGFEITMPVFAWATQTFSVDLAEAAAGYFQAIGLKVKQLPTTFDAWANKTIARSTDGWVMVQLVSFYSEPAQALISTMMPNSVTCRMYDPIITTAVNKLNAEPSAKVRQGITHDLLATLNREMLAIPLFTTDNAVAVTSKVGKWTPVPGASQMTNIAGIRP
jgi:peptide/nickel transport system substrate-binding protein